MIVVGYQGIGKSTLAGKDNCIDLESGNFWVNGFREKNWYKPYCQIANHLSEQGYTVFVSSHEVVRKELEKSKEDVVIIYPSLTLKYQWIEKLKTRYENTELVKDFKAWQNAKEMYSQNIEDLSDFDRAVKYGFIRYEIGGMNYELSKIIAQIKTNLEYRKRDE